MNTINSLSFSRAGYYRPYTVRAYVTVLSALAAAIRSEGAITGQALAAKSAFSHLSITQLSAMVDSLVRAGCVEREGSQWLLWVNPTVQPDDSAADSDTCQASQLSTFAAVA